MGELIFQGMQVEEIDLTNKLQGEQQLNIEQRSSFNVKYTNDNKHCAATLTIDMMHKEKPMDFNFKVEVVGFMDIDGIMDRKEIHKSAYNELYPHVRSLVMTLLVNAGLPPINIPKVKMDDSNIKIGGNGEENAGGLYS